MENITELLSKTLSEKDKQIKEYQFDSLCFRFNEAVNRGHKERVRENISRLECSEYQAEHSAHVIDARDKQRFYEILREAMGLDA